MAEVLITLGIIGVVAALTIPTLIANHKKQVVVTRMEKFYSTINQAIKRSMVDNEDAANWDDVEYLDADSLYIWWNKYLNKYMITDSVEKVSNGILIALSDGSGFGIYNPSSAKIVGIDWMHIVYCVDYKACKMHIDKGGGKIYPVSLDGKNTFLFYGAKNEIKTYGSGRERDELISSAENGYACSQSYKAFCSALIESDGWKIEKDYPVGF